MAILWDGAAGLFTDIGKIIGVANNWETVAEETLDTHLNEIVAAFDDTTMTHIEGLEASFIEFNNRVTAFRKSIGKVVESRLRDVQLIVNELKLSDKADIITILTRLREQMIVDAETVKRNVITLGSVVAATPNVGNATVITTKVLDGWSKPGDFFECDRAYNGLDSEMSAKSETLTIECISDSQAGSTRQEGGETWKVWGNPANPADNTPTPYFGQGVEGSGSSKEGFIVGPQAGTLVAVPGFDVWTDDATPDLTGGWTLDGGTLGTHVLQEETIVYRGDAALEFFGSGGVTPLQVSQALSVAKLKPLRRYLVSVRYRADAAVAAGTFKVEFTGTGYVSGSAKIEKTAGAIATSWTLETFQVNLPAVIPSDFKIVISVTGPITDGRSIYVDDVYVQPMYYFGGVGMAIVPGSIKSVKQDRYSFTIANDRGGVIQSFWGRYFGRQLPSVSIGETISDSLATASTVDTTPS